MKTKEMNENLRKLASDDSSEKVAGLLGVIDEKIENDMDKVLNKLDSLEGKIDGIKSELNTKMDTQYKMLMVLISAIAVLITIYKFIE